MRSSVILAIVAVLASACASNDASATGVDVVVTTSVLGDIVVDLVGADGEVEVLIGPGADPHDFSLSAAGAARLRTADLVVANGLGLEESLIDTLAAAADDGARILYVAPAVDPLPSGDEDHPGDDPHFWLDPLRMADATDVIAAALAEVASGAWKGRAADLRSEIEDLHARSAATLETVPQNDRELVTNHDSLGYFAARYGFEVVATVIPGGSTMAETSAAELADLVETLRERQVRAIFTDVSSSAAVAEAAAAELGEPVSVHPLHTESLGEPGTEADSYVGMMDANVATIVEALAGDRP